ncbi:MAG: hypothetical protein GX962_15070 [Epulopiscium sp.]|nr:hypothetical protein [Candidatus Epulonipiscium sp.]
MGKKFAYITFHKIIEESSSSWKNQFLLKAQNYYIKKRQPIFLQEIEIADVIGYEVQIPGILEDIIKNEMVSRARLLTKLMVQLQKYEVEVMAWEQPWLDQEQLNIPVVQGQEMILFFILPAILKILPIISKPLESLEICVIGGPNKRTNLILDLIYPHFNFLTLMTEKPDTFLKKGEQIYEEVGLLVNFVEKKYNRVIHEDVIINLEPDDTSFYFCKKGTVYFDYSGSREHTKKILLNRNDIIVIDDLSLLYQEQEFSTKLLELIWFSQDPTFRHHLLYGYDPKDLSRLMSYIKRNNMEVCSFHQYGKDLRDTPTKRCIDIF